MPARARRAVRHFQPQSRSGRPFAARLRGASRLRMRGGAAARAASCAVREWIRPFGGTPPEELRQMAGGISAASGTRWPWPRRRAAPPGRWA
jgi:hypothetical protein